jgi:hypothetical protein
MLRQLRKVFKHVYSFNFPKHHQAFAHVLEFIERAGSPNNGRVGALEISHNNTHDIYSGNTNFRSGAMKQLFNKVSCCLFVQQS